MDGLRMDEIDKLPTNDKLELQNFLHNENEKAKIQSRTHTLTDMCWKKCITGKISSNLLAAKEDACMQNCVERFFDSYNQIIKHLETVRSAS